MDPIYEAYKNTIMYGGIKFVRDKNAYVTKISYNDSNEVWVGYYEIRIEVDGDKPTSIQINEYKDKKFSGTPKKRAQFKPKSKNIDTVIFEAFKKLNAKGVGLRYSNKSIHYKDNIQRYSDTWGMPYK